MAYWAECPKYWARGVDEIGPISLIPARLTEIGQNMRSSPQRNGGNFVGGRSGNGPSVDS